MISQLSMWQIVVDLCLVTSILVMAFRGIKTSRMQALLPQALELQVSLRKAIAEAESASRHINDQLLRREQNLHKYVTQLERHEKELSLAVVEAESLTKELHLACESARIESKELATVIDEGEALKHSVTIASQPTQAPSSRSAGRSAATRAPSSKPAAKASVAQDEVQFSTKRSSRRAAEWIPAEEPMDVTDTVAEDREERTAPGMQALQELYGRAESMLKQGQALEQVSRVTSLPVEGVKRLAEMIEIEREEEVSQQKTRKGSKAPADPRLGALGIGRRPDSRA